MNVLSLFDGTATGYQALKNIGVKVDNYYASEIDKYAIAVAKYNHPEIIHLGDVTKVDWFGLPKIDLLIGGSPCTGFSFAGKQLNFNDPQSKLFYEYVRILHELKPKYFMLENVRMKKEYQDIISQHLGVQPIVINSALVSAQNRVRLYWVGRLNDDSTYSQVDVSQPEDRGILLRDIIEDNPHSESYIKQNEIDWISNKKRLEKKYTAINPEKALTMTARQYTSWNGTYLTGGAMRGRYLDDNKSTEQRIEIREDNKSNCIASVQKDSLCIQVGVTKHGGYEQNNRVYSADGKSPCISARDYKDPKKISCIQVGEADLNGHDIIKRVYSPDGKSPTLTMTGGGNQEPKISQDLITWRKLTPIECERLQTLPTKEKIIIISLEEILCLDQAKNYVNAVTKNHKLQKLVLSAESKKLQEHVRNVINNINANRQSIKHTVQKNVGTQILLQINKCTIAKQIELATPVGNVGSNALCQNQEKEPNFADSNVFINITAGQIQLNGKVGYHLKDNHFKALENGSNVLKLSIREIMELVNPVELETKKKIDTYTISITSSHLNIKNIEQILIILYYFARIVIGGCIVMPTQIRNLYVKFNDGYTALGDFDGIIRPISNAQRYKMLGNGWTCEVIEHIFKEMLNV